MKVFQEKSGNLVEFKGLTGKKDFDYENEIQKLIENNLNTVFPNLEFLTTEYRIENLRPDSVAFDIESNAFVIIEYKFLPSTLFIFNLIYNVQIGFNIFIVVNFRYMNMTL